MTQTAATAASNYVIRVVEDPSAIAPQAWNALLAQQSHPSPFMRHEYLLALHASQSAVAATGWQPHFLLLEQEGLLLAACALYQKAHSYGEYVFDWAWADAYRRHGLRYYPKLLAALPFTPVPGSRLLAVDEVWRQRLAHALTGLAKHQAWSSAHVLFLDPADQQALASEGWMARSSVQFHWQQDASQPCTSFEDFLSRLQREKRKKIQQERRRVAEQGVVLTAHQGSEITEGLWDFFYNCYTLTYQSHHSTPYLTRDFFRHMAAQMPQHWLMFVARLEGRPIASSLIAIDADTRTAWGRYWGCTQNLPCLHFEACYYQPLAWCITQGYRRFEGGAQGEHKMARGLGPVATRSAHWINDSRFASAVADFLQAEGQGMEAYVDELRERSPYKQPGVGSG